MMQCILPQGQTTPEKLLSNPFSGKSFFEPGQYKSAIHRCEDGFHSSELGIEIFTDLVSIYDQFVKQMKHWSTASQKKIAQSKDFGTNKRSWLDVVRAVESTAQPAADLSKAINTEVVQTLTKYKTDYYGKSFLHLKKSKEFEKEFRKVQKSWIELLEKISEAKEVCKEAEEKLNRAEKSANYYESDAAADPEEITKIKLSVDKYRKNNQLAKEKHKRLMEDLEKTKPQYQTSMTDVLNRTHDFERQRLRQFRQTFENLQKILAVEKVTNYTAVSTSFTSAISGHDIELDITRWNENYGSASKVPWPSVENNKE